MYKFGDILRNTIVVVFYYYYDILGAVMINFNLRR